MVCSVVGAMQIKLRCLRVVLPPIQDLVANECRLSALLKIVKVGLSYQSSSLFPSEARMLHLQGIRAVSGGRKTRSPMEEN